MVGVGVFDKVDMIGWMLEGIRDNFDPSQTEVVFFFEACTDESESEFDRLAPIVLEGWRCSKGASEDHINEVGVHCWLIDRFMESACEALIIPHDDNRFTRPLVPDLRKLRDRYGDSLGWISGRDGHGIGYADMCCSPFSKSTGAPMRALEIGTWEEVLMMNTGPVVYFRHVVEKVGKPDVSLPWYNWSDYSLRCHHAGLKNILLSMDCLHEKFGRVTANPPELYNDKLVADCLKRLNERWAPVLGRNPL